MRWRSGNSNAGQSDDDGQMQVLGASGGYGHGKFVNKKVDRCTICGQVMAMMDRCKVFVL